MRNRAKCVLCSIVIESLGAHDYITCKCGHISLQGGKCIAGEWENFLRVHDDDSEHPVKVVEKKEEPKPEQEPLKRLTRDELIKMLDAMVENIEKLPSNAMTAPITHYDFCSALILISEAFKAS